MIRKVPHQDLQARPGFRENVIQKKESLRRRSMDLQRVLAKLFVYRRVELAENALQRQGDDGHLRLVFPCTRRPFDLSCYTEEFKTNLKVFRRDIFGRKPANPFENPRYLVWLLDGLEAFRELLEMPPECGLLGQPLVDGFLVQAASYFEAVIQRLSMEAAEKYGA